MVGAFSPLLGNAPHVGTPGGAFQHGVSGLLHSQGDCSNMGLCTLPALPTPCFLDSRLSSTLCSLTSLCAAHACPGAVPQASHQALWTPHVLLLQVTQGLPYTYICRCCAHNLLASCAGLLGGSALLLGGVPGARAPAASQHLVETGLLESQVAGVNQSTTRHTSQQERYTSGPSSFLESRLPSMFCSFFTL
jgi:hypothetical protein